MELKTSFPVDEHWKWRQFIWINDNETKTTYLNCYNIAKVTFLRKEQNISRNDNISEILIKKIIIDKIR